MSLITVGHAIMTSHFLEVLLGLGERQHFTTLWLVNLVVKLGHAIMTSFFLELLLAAILGGGAWWGRQAYSGTCHTTEARRRPCVTLSVEAISATGPFGLACWLLRVWSGVEENLSSLDFDDLLLA